MGDRLSVNIPEAMNQELEELVARGIYSSKTAAIEDGLRRVFKEYGGLRYDSVAEELAEDAAGLGKRFLGRK